MVELRDQLSEATKQIDAMAGEYVQVFLVNFYCFSKIHSFPIVQMRESDRRHNEVVDGLRSENSKLRSLLEEYKDKQQRQEGDWEDKVGWDHLLLLLLLLMLFTYCRF